MRFFGFLSHQVSLVTPTLSKGIVKSYQGRSKTPISWCSQLDTTILSRYVAMQHSGHPSYHVGPTLGAWYTLKYKTIQLWDRRFHRYSSLHAASDTSMRVLRVLLLEKTSAARSRISSELIFASCVGYFGRANYRFYMNLTMLVLNEGGTISQLRNSTDAYICSTGYVCDLIENACTLLGKSGKLLLETGHEILGGNGGSGGWS